jgi:para-nitrobenzyl esterase
MTQLPTAIARRGVLVGAAALVAAPAVLRAADAAPEFITVETAEGRLKGKRIGGVDSFLGVPYGAPVSGVSRFKPARPAEAWTGVRDALALGVPTLQAPNTVYGRNEPAPGEDCLVLNVWAPASGGKGKPVMFYCHGGGFTTGSAGSTAQDGSNLAREYDVVVVATNHRLGLLGYLYLGELGGAEYAGSGNQGMSDIVLGLKWVRRNIAAFGGDPDNIMIFGESGGGAKTSCLYAMPSIAPMFAKAAIQSGPAVRIGTPETAARTTRKFLDQLGIAPADWKKLLEIPAPAFLDAQWKLIPEPGKGGAPGPRGIADFTPGGYGPIVDGDLLPRHPFEPDAPPVARDKPLIVGWLDCEAAFFAMAGHDVEAFKLTDEGLRGRLKPFAPEPVITQIIDTYRSDRPGADASDIWLALLSERVMGAGSIAIAERKAAQGGAPVYYYNLAYKTNRKMEGTDRELGAMHAIDIPLVFDNVGTPDTLAGSRADRAEAAKNMSALWTSFAHTSQPKAPGQPAWPAYSLADRATMVIDVQCSVVNDRFGAERKMWEGFDKVVA